jgi:hypothetical protein
LTYIAYTKNLLSSISLSEVLCEFAATVFCAIEIALLKNVCNLDATVCDNVEENYMGPVQVGLAADEGSFLKVSNSSKRLPVWFCTFACCIIYVEAKISVIVNVIIANTATIIKFLFLVCSVVSPLK